MKTEKMRWCVIVESISRGELYEMNVFDHSRFNANLQEFMKKKPSRNELSNELHRLCMYYFWSKCEWEIVVRSLFHENRDACPEMKIDVYDQLKMNWEIFVDYVWQYCPKRRLKEERVNKNEL